MVTATTAAIIPVSEATAANIWREIPPGILSIFDSRMLNRSSISVT
jgi:hypothetical protein